jgi:uncharacterized 2Fe-2S/4Fe-4S cluster protein (DUF4445 family)
VTDFRITYLPEDRASRAPTGTTLFAAAHRAGLRIDSSCGGRGNCGRCRVRLVAGEVEPSAADQEHLSPDLIEAGWRLSCQVEVRGDLVCSIPPVPSRVRAVTGGEEREVSLEPSLRKVPLQLDPSSAEEALSDVERLRRALRRAGHGLRIDPPALRRLAAMLDRAGKEPAAVLCGEHLVDLRPASEASGLYGAAFDIGTTSVVGSLLNLETGSVEVSTAAVNRQAVFGADVISRIAHAMQGPGERAELQEAVVATINEILSQLYRRTDLGPEEVGEAVIVGNATMLHLLLGVDPRSISVAPFTPVFKETITLRAAALGLDLHPLGRVTTFPLIGAYVGADTVAGLHASGLARDDRLWLFIDIGTNTEVALGSRERILATSAPAGPAFEGGRIRCGMMAQKGAIEKVRLGDTPELAVIGGGAPRGLCGSGLIDLVAQLRLSGLLSVEGRLGEPGGGVGSRFSARLVKENGVTAFRLTEEVSLTQLDVRELQSAKGSVATAIEVLMELLGVDVEEIDEVLLAGAFGSSIDPASARVIGLTPAVLPGRIRFLGNTAIEGAQIASLSFRERRMAFDLPSRVDYVELSARSDFNERFLANLAFPELEVDR